MPIASYNDIAVNRNANVLVFGDSFAGQTNRFQRFLGFFMAKYGCKGLTIGFRGDLLNWVLRMYFPDSGGLTSTPRAEHAFLNNNNEGDNYRLFGDDYDQFFSLPTGRPFRINIRGSAAAGGATEVGAGNNEFFRVVVQTDIILDRTGFNLFDGTTPWRANVLMPLQDQSPGGNQYTGTVYLADVAGIDVGTPVNLTSTRVMQFRQSSGDTNWAANYNGAYPQWGQINRPSDPDYRTGNEQGDLPVENWVDNGDGTFGMVLALRGVAVPSVSDDYLTFAALRLAEWDENTSDYAEGLHYAILADNSWSYGGVFAGDVEIGDIAGDSTPKKCSTTQFTAYLDHAFPKKDRKVVAFMYFAGENGTQESLETKFQAIHDGLAAAVTAAGYTAGYELVLVHPHLHSINDSSPISQADRDQHAVNLAAMEAVAAANANVEVISIATLQGNRDLSVENADNVAYLESRGANGTAVAAATGGDVVDDGGLHPSEEADIVTVYAESAAFWGNEFDLAMQAAGSNTSEIISSVTILPDGDEMLVQFSEPVSGTWAGSSITFDGATFPLPNTVFTSSVDTRIELTDAVVRSGATATLSIPQGTLDAAGVEVDAATAFPTTNNSTKAPEITLQRGLNYGKMVVNEPRTRAPLIRNDGTATLVLSSPQVTGDLTVVDSGVVTIAPGQQRLCQRFEADSATPVADLSTSTAQLTTNDSDETTLAVPVTGSISAATIISSIVTKTASVANGNYGGPIRP